MATADELRVVVKAEVDRATAEIKQFNTQLNKSGQQATKSAVNMAKLAAGVTAGVAAFRGAVRIVRDLTDAYAVQERAEAKLAAVLRATGEAAGFNQQQLESMASGLQGVTTFGDEAILNMQSLLLTFKGIQGEAFERTTELALDLSAAFDQDLKSSALQLGKALEDPATGLTALRRIGVSFTEEQTNMIEAMLEAGEVASAQGVILDTLEGQVGGVAQAMADTATGGGVQFNNIIGDLKENIGELLSQGLRPLREEFAGLISDINERMDLRSVINEADELFLALQGGSGGIANASASDIEQLLATYEDALERQRNIRQSLLNVDDRNFAQRARLQKTEESIADIVQQIEDIMVLTLPTQMDAAGAAMEQAEAEERARAAAEARAAAAERQAAINERYMDVRAEVLRILESEKTEVEKIREQIDYLNANPWSGGAREEDRLAAIEILQQRIAELTADTDESADAASGLAAGLDRAALSAGDLGASVGSLNDQTEDAVSFAEKYADELERAADVAMQIGAQALSEIGGALGGEEFDVSGLMRSAAVGITDAFFPGVGQIAGGIYDVLEGAYNQLFGPSQEALEAAVADAENFQVELSDAYKSEVDLRREYLKELQQGFDTEFEVLRDQWERNLISTSEFSSAMSDLNEGFNEGEDDAEARAAADAAADLEAARKEKIDGLKAGRGALQKELDDMSWWDKLWSGRDEELQAGIDTFNSRIATAEAATSLSGVKSAATGANFVTSGPELLLVGDNPGGREHVMVDPAPGSASGMTININAPVYGVDDLYAKLEEAGQRMRRRGRVA